ncbi:ROK family transcriptional regulator [uncultured Pseudokineococcus sp.]|uniref:ROK family transcriptional regulator n=1 Tax=uncultured Pseudokineococcus sp. TaxID=1642928 RepID=UPI002636F665|nr:ROK family transcriptional regulator [uncultured Pseudokineococcus sp.]
MTAGGAPQDAGALVPPGAAPVLRLLRSGPPRTRSEIAAETGLARSTVQARVDQLVAAGLVAPAGEAPSTGGRPPARVEFRPDARVVLAVDLGAAHGSVAVADLAGRALGSRSRALSIADGPGPVLDWVAEAAAELVAELGGGSAAGSSGVLGGAGVGLPGPVEHATGRPVRPPIMPGWDGVDVPGEVRARLVARGLAPPADDLGRDDLPVLVDNDVNLLALGEHASSWPAEEDLLFVKVATGVGAGVVSGGRLQRGAQGSAGDLGAVHVAGPGGAGAPGAPDDGTTLEALASGTAVAARLRAQGRAARTSRDVVALVRAGDPLALDLVRQAGRDLGEVLSTCVNLLNPGALVVGGSLALAGEDLLAGVREVVYRRSTPLATRHLTIATPRAGADGALLGAALVVAQHLLDPA